MDAKQIAKKVLLNAAKMNNDVVWEETDIEAIMAINGDDYEMVDGEVAGFDNAFEDAVTIKIDVEALVDLACSLFEMDEEEKLIKRVDGMEDLDTAVDAIVEYMIANNSI